MSLTSTPPIRVLPRALLVGVASTPTPGGCYYALRLAAWLRCVGIFMDAHVRSKRHRPEPARGVAPRSAEAKADHGFLSDSTESALVDRLATRPGTDASNSQASLIIGLQGSSGNAAVLRVVHRLVGDGALVHRKIVAIGSEKVEVSDSKEALETAEATKIIADIKSSYGIELSSSETIEAIKAQHTNVSDAVKNSLKARQWRMIELRSLAKALKNSVQALRRGDAGFS
jgi:hypothetical protein